MLMNKEKLLALSNAMKYFQIPINSEISPRQLEVHLQGVAGVFKGETIGGGLLESLLLLMVKRYYQVCSYPQATSWQEYLLISFVQTVRQLYQLVAKGSNRISKDHLIVILSATISLSKRLFEPHKQKCNDLRSSCLQFALQIITILAKRKDCRIEEVYPKLYSLCSSVIRGDRVSLKHFSICLEIIQLLVRQNVSFRSSEQGGKFLFECLKRLSNDVDYLCNVFYKYEMGYRQKVRPLCQQLLNVFVRQSTSEIVNPATALQEQNSWSLKNELFSKIVLLAQLSELPFQFDNLSFYQQTVVEDSYRYNYLNSCKQLRKVDIDMAFKKRELERLTYLNSFAKFQGDEDDPLLKMTTELLQHIFSIRKSHQLITIPSHSSTIPLQPLSPQHCPSSYPVKGLDRQYSKQLSRVLAEVMPFFQLQPFLVDATAHMLESMLQINRKELLHFFSDQLLKCEYSLNMSVTQLFHHIQVLCILKFLINRKRLDGGGSAVSSIFYTLTQKTDSIRTLKTSYVEEELLVAITLSLTTDCYLLMKQDLEQQGKLGSRVKTIQVALLFIQRILNSFSEGSYIIRLSCLIGLLQFTGSLKLQDSLKKLQSTIISRNKNNLQLTLNLLSLTTMSQVDYQELALYYMQHQGAQPVLRYLLPHISIESARKCILTVERWWLLLSKQVIQWLNCKEMKKSEDQGENFAVKDGQNVIIKNGLGVIIIQLGEKWSFYLRSQKRQTIINVLIQLAIVNPKAVFFKGCFSFILQQLFRILQETLGRKVVGKTTVIQTEKVNFYGRLRQKIYKLLILLPSENNILFKPAVLQSLKELLSEALEKVKRSYLFEGMVTQKGEYELLKELVPRWTDM